LLSGIAENKEHLRRRRGGFYFQPVEKGLADCTGGNSRPNPESLLSGIAENKEHLRRQGRFLFSACGKGTRRLEDFNQWNGGANFTEGNG